MGWGVSFSLWLPAVTQMCILPDNDKVYLLSSLWQETSGQLYIIYIRTPHRGLILSMSIWCMYIYISCTSEVLTQLLVQLNLYPDGSISLHAAFECTFIHPVAQQSSYHFLFKGSSASVYFHSQASNDCIYSL